MYWLTIMIFGIAESIIPSLSLRLLFVNLYEINNIYHSDPSKWVFYGVQLNINSSWQQNYFLCSWENACLYSLYQKIFVFLAYVCTLFYIGNSSMGAWNTIPHWKTLKVLKNCTTKLWDAYFCYLHFVWKQKFWLHVVYLYHMVFQCEWQLNSFLLYFT